MSGEKLQIPLKLGKLLESKLKLKNLIRNIHFKYDIMPEHNERYKIDNFLSKALEGNPLNSPVKRDLKIYLPPGYFESDDKRYPSIYYIHGYGGNNRGWTVTGRNSKDKTIPWELIPKKILKRVDMERITTFETLGRESSRT